jgi:hypothetical protein
MRRVASVLLLCTAVRGAWFGGPAHVHSRPSAIQFWALDVSAGAGSLSSPVRNEHYRNASRAIVLGERYGSRLATGLPRWLLLSVVGISSRELTSRDVRDRLVPALYESRDAQEKAASTAERLRRNLDDRVSRIIRGVTTRRPGEAALSTQAILDKFLQEEREELQASMGSVQDVVENELTRALTEVLQLELAERLEKTASAAVQLNVSSSYTELSALLAAADKNSDGHPSRPTSCARPSLRASGT